MPFEAMHQSNIYTCNEHFKRQGSLVPIGKTEIECTTSSNDNYNSMNP
jgi:hypothetical protein